MRLDTENQPSTKNGTVMMGREYEISNPVSSLTRIAIPVTPPSKKPLGSKKAFKPILANKIAKAIDSPSQIHKRDEFTMHTNLRC